MQLSSEFQFVVNACRWPPTRESEAALASAAATVDWPLVARIAARHRVEGLVYAALGRQDLAPAPEAAQSLEASATRIARQNLDLAATSLLIRRRLEEAGAPCLFVKGVTLGALAYGNIGLKMGWDIDLLVPPRVVERAADVLEALGYRLINPALPRMRERMGPWHGLHKESVWAGPGGRHVELHTRLPDNPRVLWGVGPDSPAREVEVAKGLFLPTLENDSLFAYLCVHGASSAWFRLKWLADVGALIGDQPAEEVERLYRCSQELGAGRAAAQALLLSHRLFGTALSPALEAELVSDRVTRWLVTTALRKLAGRTMVAEVHQTRLGTVTIHLMQLGLLPGWRYKVSETWRQMVTPYDRFAVPLPRPLRFLYPAVAAARRLTGRP